jgi:hypothetical protein
VCRRDRCCACGFRRCAQRFEVLSKMPASVLTCPARAAALWANTGAAPPTSEVAPMRTASASAPEILSVLASRSQKTYGSQQTPQDRHPPPRRPVPPPRALLVGHREGAHAAEGPDGF